MKFVAFSRPKSFLTVCLAALTLLAAACDKKDDAANSGPKPPGTELSTVADVSIKRVAADSKAESSKSFTFSGLDAKSVELDDLILDMLPADGHMGDAKLPEGKYDVKITLSGKTPEELRPTLFRAIEGALGVKLSLTRKDMDGYVIGTADGTPPAALAKAKPDEATAHPEAGTGGHFSAVTMETFADWAATGLGMPVANATDLPGKYTFDLPTGKVDAAVLTSAAKALGLVVTPRRLEQQVLMAEKVEAAP